MKKILYSLLVLSFFAACEKTVTIDIPKKDPRLVINGWMELNKVIQLTVGKSRYILDPLQAGNQMESYVVKNAIAVVYENNIPVDTLVYHPGFMYYKSSQGRMVRSGYTYTVRVNAPGFSQAEATTIVPSQSAIAELKRIRNARTNNMGDPLDEITIKLNDPAEKNFYLVKIFHPDYSGVGESYTVYCVSTTDKDIEPIGENADPLSTDNCFDGGSLIMKDDHFNGSQKQLRFYVSSSEVADYTNPGGSVRRAYVKVHRITEDYFKYLKSYHVYYNSSDNPFAEPVNVFTNVKNGYGILSAHTMAVDTLR